MSCIFLPKHGFAQVHLNLLVSSRTCINSLLKDSHALADPSIFEDDEMASSLPIEAL
jgi:hypothetical protein